jgi:hypothetical protein
VYLVQFFAPLVVKNEYDDAEHKSEGQEVVNKSKLKKLVFKVDSLRIKYDFFKVKQYFAENGRGDGSFIFLQSGVLILSVIFS